MTTLDKSAILAAAAPDRLRRETLHVPELGGSVACREMTGSERDRWEEVHSTLKYRQFRARTAASCLCDADGNFLFSDQHLEALGNLPATALDRIYECAKRLNALTEEDVASLEKNCKSDPGDATS